MAGTLKVGTITTPSGSGTITIPSGVTLSGGGLTNTPAFKAYNGSSQTISTSTTTTIQANTEFYDTDGYYNTSTYRFTPLVSGKYFLFAIAKLGLASGNYFENKIYKNGATQVLRNVNHVSAGVDILNIVSGVVEANGTTDYFTWLISHNYGSDRTFDSESNTSFWGGFKLIG